MYNFLTNSKQYCLYIAFILMLGTINCIAKKYIVMPIIAILVIFAIYYLIQHRKQLKVPLAAIIYISFSLAYIFICLILELYNNGLNDTHAYSLFKYIIIINIILVFLLQIEVPSQHWQNIFLVSTLLSASIGAYQKYILQYEYPFHHMVNKIPAAQIMTVLSTISFSIVLHMILTKNFNIFKLSLALFTALFGFFIVLLTETRGVFLGLVLAFCYLFYTIVKNSPQTYLKYIISGSLIVVIGFSYLVYNSNTGKRFMQSVEMLQQDYTFLICHPTQSKESSTALRFMYWNLAIKGIKQRPFTGHGSENFLAFVKSNHIEGCDGANDGSGYHTHNDFFNILFCYGIVGLIIMLLFLFYPLYIFYKTNINNNIMSIIGIITILEMLGCQLTDVPLWNTPVLIAHLLIISICLSSILTQDKLTATKS